MENLPNIKVSKISLRLNTKDGQVPNQPKRKNCNNLSIKIKENCLLINGSWLFKVGEFLPMPSRKSANYLFLILFITRLQKELKK